MFGYYTDLAWRSLRRNKVLTALMVLAIGLGIGASMTMITVLHVLNADPAPGRSARLFHPGMDPRNMEDYVSTDEPPAQLTWIDAMNLLRSREGTRKAAMVGGRVAVRPARQGAAIFYANARFTSADFFTMFGVPRLQGETWSAAEDQAQAHVVVIDKVLATRVYGSADPVGQTLRLGSNDFRVVGVIAPWGPMPHFYDLDDGGYQPGEQVFVPLSTAMALKLSTRSSMVCWGDVDFDHLDPTTATCTWMQFWVQLDTPAQVRDYRQFLVNYSAQQKALGRFVRPPNTRLDDVMQWLQYNKVVPGNIHLEALLAFAFLLVCLVNTVALLLVKFLRRGGEMGVRRAMGASKRAVFIQLMIESLMVGAAGGLIGLLLTLLGLWIVRQQPADYAALAQLDAPMLATTLVMAIVTTAVAAIFPAWRACRLPPARALKIQ